MSRIAETARLKSFCSSLMQRGYGNMMRSVASLACLLQSVATSPMSQRTMQLRRITCRSNLYIKQSSRKRQSIKSYLHLGLTRYPRRMKQLTTQFPIHSCPNVSLNLAEWLAGTISRLASPYYCLVETIPWSQATFGSSRTTSSINHSCLRNASCKLTT